MKKKTREDGTQNRVKGIRVLEGWCAQPTLSRYKCIPNAITAAIERELYYQGGIPFLKHGRLPLSQPSAANLAIPLIAAAVGNSRRLLVIGDLITNAGILWDFGLRTPRSISREGRNMSTEATSPGASFQGR